MGIADVEDLSYSLKIYLSHFSVLFFETGKNSDMEHS